MFKNWFQQSFYKWTAPLLMLAFAFGALGVGTAHAAPKIPTVTSVAFSAFPSAGLPLTVTATVTPSNAIGTVSFTAMVGRLRVTLPGSCASAPVSGGSASCTFTPANTGTYTFAAKFTDTKVYASSTGNGSVVIELATSTAGSFSASPIVGSPVIVTATVTPAAATGAIAFTAAAAGNAVSLPTGCTNAAISGGQAICTFTPTTAGLYNFTAISSGDSTYAASTGTGTMTIMIPTTTIVTDNATTIADGPAPVIFGGTIVFTATVSSANASPNGTVQWSLSHDGPDDATSGSGIVGACQGNVPVINGIATCSVTPGYWYDSGNGMDQPFYWGIRATATFTPAANSGFGGSSGSDSTTKITTGDRLMPWCRSWPGPCLVPMAAQYGEILHAYVENTSDSLGRNLDVYWCYIGLDGTGCPTITSGPEVLFPALEGVFPISIAAICPEGVSYSNPSAPEYWTGTFECLFPNHLSALLDNRPQDSP